MGTQWYTSEYLFAGMWMYTHCEPGLTPLKKKNLLIVETFRIHFRRIIGFSIDRLVDIWQLC